MDEREAFQPTVPQPAIVPPPAPAPLRSRSHRVEMILLVVVTLLVGIAIGMAIARATGTAPTATPVSELGHLTITSKPTDGNVTLDGRFAGVSPLERLDLDPGKHSVVIDAFGYKPYSGTLVIQAAGKLNLSVLLAPIGVDGMTSGNATGAGSVTRVVVPPSALLPATSSAPPPAPGAPAPELKKATRRSEAPTFAPPRRDCDGEKSRCTDNCRRASTDCDFSCPGCSSCNTSIGWDECKRQCDTCRGSCQNNTKFCESSCATQADSCEASQRN